MQVATNKWNKLGIELKNFLKENLNGFNSFNKPVSQLLRDFSQMHDTTYSSTVFYYYNDVKQKLEDELRNGYVETSETETIEEVEEVEEVKEVEYVDEVNSLVEHIESETDYKVSIESKDVIKEMIENYGAIKTMIAVFNMIENVDKIDMFNVIVREASKRI